MRSASCSALSCTAVAAALAVFLGGASSALATFTTVNPPTGEETHAEILSHIYGGTFAPTFGGSHDYTNGTVTAQRVEDVLAGNTLRGATDVIGDTQTDDQLWLADYKLA